MQMLHYISFYYIKNIFLINLGVVSIFIFGLDFVVSEEPNSALLMRGLGIGIICMVTQGIYIGNIFL